MRMHINISGLFLFFSSALELCIQSFYQVQALCLKWVICLVLRSWSAQCFEDCLKSRLEGVDPVTCWRVSPWLCYVLQLLWGGPPRENSTANLILNWTTEDKKFKWRWWEWFLGIREELKTKIPIVNKMMDWTKDVSVLNSSGSFRQTFVQREISVGMDMIGG